jgi:hypothetical protein
LEEKGMALQNVHRESKVIWFPVSESNVYGIWVKSIQA